MRLICSHMKDSLIESESRFHCLGVSTLTPDSHSALWTTQGLMEAGTLTNTYVNTLAHNVFLRGKCANITSGAFTMEARENETKACSSKIPRVLAQTRILQMRILHHRRYTRANVHLLSLLSLWNVFLDITIMSPFGSFFRCLSQSCRCVSGVFSVALVLPAESSISCES